MFCHLQESEPGGPADDGATVYDGELILGAAVHLASQMHLELDVEIAVAHRRNHRHSKVPASEELSVETLDRARVVSGATQMLHSKPFL